MVFDPNYTTIDISDFKGCRWKDFYRKLREATPSNAPEERGTEVDIRGYIDSNHTGENKTRRSCYGYLIFLHTALIQRFSKKQYTNRDVCVCCRVSGHEGCHGDAPRDKI